VRSGDSRDVSHGDFRHTTGPRDSAQETGRVQHGLPRRVGDSAISDDSRSWAGAAYGTGDPTVSQTETPSAAEYTARVVQLRSELRDAVQTLSNARRAEVWEIVNKLIHLERLDAGR